MNVITLTTFLACLLPTVGFAIRGLSLIFMCHSRPRNVVSISGATAMVSMWLFAGAMPHLARGARDVFAEFDLRLHGFTAALLNILTLPLNLGVFWYLLAFLTGVVALLVPEVFLTPRGTD